MNMASSLPTEEQCTDEVSIEKVRINFSIIITEKQRVTQFVLQPPSSPPASCINSIPELNADVLEHIFGFLELKDLYAVARCSHQFEEYAQLAFQNGFLDGRYSTKGLSHRRNVKTHAPLLRIFGKYIRHFEDRSVPLKILESSKLWTVLEPAKLKTLYTTHENILAYMNMPGAKKLSQLERLAFSRSSSGRLRMNFNEWCPKLKTLKLESLREFQVDDVSWIPRNLEALEVRRNIFYFCNPDKKWKLEQLMRNNPKLKELKTYGFHVDGDNGVLDLLCNNGVQMNWVKLRCWLDMYEIGPYLGQFQRLEHLWIETIINDEDAEEQTALATTIRSLANLKTLIITGYNFNVDKFLELFMAALPRYLRMVRFEAFNGYALVSSDEFNERLNFTQSNPPGKWIEVFFKEDARNVGNGWSDDSSNEYTDGESDNEEL